MQYLAPVGTLIALMKGEQRLANFERAKHESEYTYIRENQGWIRGSGLAILHWHSPEGPEFVVSANASHIAEYIEQLHAGDPIHEHQRALGRIFGYDPEVIEEFVHAYYRGDIDCECSKCVGVFPPEDDVELRGYPGSPRHADGRPAGTKHQLSQTLRGITLPDVRR